MKEALLTTLRDRFSTLDHFRRAADQIALLIAAESGAFIAKEQRVVETPLGQALGMRIKEPPVLVSILRAGLVLLPAFLKLYTEAPIGLVGIRRDERTASPQFYYANLPPIQKETPIFLLDPMLATGQSAAMAAKLVMEKGAEESQIVLFSILAAPEGVNFFKSQYPHIRMSIIQIDQSLSPSKWILPGLGDFGDRYFGT
jgi:uracil phosphoribosyltransferase